MKGMLLKLLKIQDREIELEKLKKKLESNTKKIRFLKTDVSRLKRRLLDVEGKLKIISKFISDEQKMEDYFVHPGHDSVTKQECDLCKGRAFGIIDYRDALLGILN